MSPEKASGTEDGGVILTFEDKDINRPAFIWFSVCNYRTINIFTSGI